MYPTTLQRRNVKSLAIRNISLIARPVTLLLLLMFSSSAIEKLKSKKIYALEGNIGAGKTTIMKIISNHFNDVEFVEEPVSQWQNLGGMNLLDAFYTDPKRWGFSFEFYSLLTKIQALLKAAESDKPIIIIERSIFSNKIFMDLSKELGKLE